MALQEGGSGGAGRTRVDAPGRHPDSARRPLAQTMAAAGAMRRLSSLLLSLEHPHPTVDTMVEKFAEWERELSTAAPVDNAPRIGEVPTIPGGGLLNHATDIGAYNPCFPEYRFDDLDADKATNINSPWSTRGRQGWCTAAFWGVFFDCVIQHHNCVTGLSGKTRSLGRDVPPTDPPCRPSCGSTSLGSQVDRGIAFDGAAAAPRRSAVHRRGEHVGVTAGKAGRVSIRQAAKGVRHMTAPSTSDDRVLFEVDHDRRIATITLNNPAQRNSYDAAMREAVTRCLDRVAQDDDLTVVLLRGAEGVFSTGADMNNAYGWYGDKTKASDDASAKRRPSQRRRLTVDRKSFGFYHNFMGFPKVTVGEIAGYAC